MATKKKTQAKKAIKKKAVKKTSTRAKKVLKSDVPSLFRLNVEVGDLDQAAEFYGRLFGHS